MALRGGDFYFYFLKVALFFLWSLLFKPMLLSQCWLEISLLSFELNNIQLVYFKQVQLCLILKGGGEKRKNANHSTLS